ncbi:MAG: hypothetical protein Q9Q40_05450 [Acidobacteriota bacterium]|nr:hypothetical protein [Acidobacteriota bacterium]
MERTGRMDLQQVHRVQVDVSVIDPRGSQWGSVRGIPRSAFRLWIDGSHLDPETDSRVEFDEICPAPGEDPGGAEQRPTLIVLVDLNFLDARMRFAVARALDDLAGAAEQHDLRVKVITFRRQLMSLTDGFRSRPEAIRQTATRLRRTLSEGPSRQSPAARLEAIARDPQQAIRSPDLRGFLDPDTRRLPDRRLPAMEISLPGLDLSADRSLTGLQDVAAPTSVLAALETDPRPSLAALESVLISHASLPGRKAVILFSSGWFDLPEELWMAYTADLLLAAQRGFAIWTVDARGLLGSRGADASSRLLGYLSASTGGEFIESAGRLSVSFDRAVEQLSCYYLFSIPVAPPARGSRRHSVTVALDTKAHPEYWHYRIRSTSGFTLLDRDKLRTYKRLAALMEPTAHRFPEVRVTASYPQKEGRSYFTPIEVSVVLADLFFKAHGGTFQAELSWEGLVTDSRNQTICRLGDGREHQVRARQAPARFPPAMLILRDHCSLPGPGVYQVRVLVEDLATGEVGAALAEMEIPGPSAELATVSALRLGRNSGRDFLLPNTSTSQAVIPRDRDRRGFIPLADGEKAARSDKLMLRFVACRVSRPPAAILFREDADGSRKVLYQLLLSTGGTLASDEGSCTEYQAVVPASTLAPDHYGIALFDRNGPPASSKQLEQWLDAEHAEALILFQIEADPYRDEPLQDQQTRDLSAPCLHLFFAI